MNQNASPYSIVAIGNLAVRDINNKGQFVGGFSTDFSAPPFIDGFFADSTDNIRSLSSAGICVEEPVREANAINDNGQIIGNSSCGKHTQGLLWHTNGSQLIINGANEILCDINNHGEIVGQAVVNRFSLRQAFIFDSNNFHRELLGSLGGDYSMAYAINDRSMVVGSATTRKGNQEAFIWDKFNGICSIGTFGGKNSSARDINNLGQIIGFAETANGNSEAFVWDRAKGMSSLGNVLVRRINNLGQIVGSVKTITSSYAVVWENGVWKNLNELIEPSSGWQLLTANGINDKGQIVGKGLFQGQRCSFLLNPVGVSSYNPEPKAVLGLIAFGLLSFTMWSSDRTSTYC